MPFSQDPVFPFSGAYGAYGDDAGSSFLKPIKKTTTKLTVITAPTPNVGMNCSCVCRRTQPTNKLPANRPTPLVTFSSAWTLTRASGGARPLAKTCPATIKQQMHSPFRLNEASTSHTGSP